MTTSSVTREPERAGEPSSGRRRRPSTLPAGMSMRTTSCRRARTAACCAVLNVTVCPLPLMAMAFE